MASKLDEFGRRLMLAGDCGDFNSVGAGTDQFLPPSVEVRPYCAPWPVRAHVMSW